MQKFKVNGQSVPKTECKQTDGQTDGGDFITFLTNAVGNDRLPIIKRYGLYYVNSVSGGRSYGLLPRSYRLIMTFSLVIHGLLSSGGVL